MTATGQPRAEMRARGVGAEDSSTAQSAYECEICLEDPVEPVVTLCVGSESCHVLRATFVNHCETLLNEAG